MAIRLTELLETREVPLGHGVKVTLKPVGFAGLKAAESAAFRRARTRIRAEIEASEAVSAEGDGRAAFEERVAGVAEELLLDELVRSHVTAWSGVLDADGVTPAPLTPENWVLFRTGLPALADRLRAEIRIPSAMVVVEGNA